MSSVISKSDFSQKYYLRDQKWDPLSRPRVEVPDFLESIKDRVVNRNESCDILYAGPRGTAKSSSAMGTGMLLDKNFSIKHIAFTIDEYIELTKKLPRGSTILVDDGGMSDAASSRKSMTNDNQKMMDVVQMCRTDNHNTIYTTIDDGRLDKRIRNTFTFVATPVRKITYNFGLATVVELFENKQSIIRNPTSETFVQLSRQKPMYGSGRLTHMVIPHPPIDLMISYNKRRQERLEDARKRALTTAEYDKLQEEENYLKKERKRTTVY